jgi:hypothetical protein
LVDGEAGKLGAPEQAHDGASVVVCKTHPESIALADAVSPHSGARAIETHVEAAWPWQEACVYKVHAKLSNPTHAAMLEDEEYWHGWAVLVPPDWTTPSATWRVVDWHPQKGAPPSVGLLVTAAGNWLLKFRPEVGDAFPIGPALAGAWHEFVANVIISRDPTKGRVRLWHKLKGDPSWTEVVHHEGRTSQDGVVFPFQPWFGLGGSEWTDPAPARSLLFDEIRHGGVEAGFLAVAPGSATTP